MNALGTWTVGLAFAYTAFLLLGPRLAAARAASRGATGATDFFTANRSFSPITVALCITALFSGSSFIVILEASYRTGVSAVWYGVAEIVQILLIALLLLAPLRKRLVVTVSGLIGDRYGRLAAVLPGQSLPAPSPCGPWPPRSRLPRPFTWSRAFPCGWR